MLIGTWVDTDTNFMSIVTPSTKKSSREIIIYKDSIIFIVKYSFKNKATDTSSLLNDDTLEHINKTTYHYEMDYSEGSHNDVIEDKGYYISESTTYNSGDSSISERDGVYILIITANYLKVRGGKWSPFGEFEIYKRASKN